MKHAGVDKVVLRAMCPRTGEVCIEVADQARGFDPSLLYDKTHPSNKFDLVSIRKRMAFLGGRLTLNSSPGSGTHIGLYLPIPHHAQQDVVVPLSHPDETGLSEKILDPMTRPSSGIRVVLAEDHAVVREGLRSLLDLHLDGIKPSPYRC